MQDCEWITAESSPWGESRILHLRRKQGAKGCAAQSHPTSRPSAHGAFPERASLHAVAYLCRVIAPARVLWDQMQILTFPRLPVRYSPDPDFRNSPDIISVLTFVVFPVR